MKANKILIALSLLAAVGLSSCRKEFAELNQKPDAVTTAEPSYLATRAMTLFETNDYTYWFYNQSLYTRWSQMGASGAFSDASYGHGAVNWQNSHIRMLSYRNEIDKYIADFEHPEMKAYSAMCGVLAAYGAIYASDGHIVVKQVVNFFVMINVSHQVYLRLSCCPVRMRQSASVYDIVIFC